MGKFADDIKLLSVIKNKAADEELQKDLIKWSKLATIWQMYFNVHKYKVLHLRKRNLKCTYSS